ncbi:MAG TPA: UDP-N-acetylmuramoyl-L-alanine--D-glutamate ligase [Stellaceae bacterium]|nr:UDP-N-acetylmuramoyl-L-alanine--D-glutamate ligase [Stellaceae bacterium]
MVVVEGFAGRKVGVLGLARSGRAAAAALRAGGAEVLAWDDSEKARAAAELPLTDPERWRDIAALVLSPGIPTTFPKPHPAVIRAHDANTEIVGDIELLYRARKGARFIGITGTNGKSTTTALIGHILKEAGLPTEVGGNLGTAALSLAPSDNYVLEASSYQLELLNTAVFDIAVLLNVTPDHLDRHGGMDGYIAAKGHIFDRQGAECSAVIGVDDAICAAMCERLRGGNRRVVPVSVNRAVAGGVYVEAGWLVDAIAGSPRRVFDLATAERLPGAHNWQNAAAAYAAARRAGLSEAVATAAIRSFPGLAHRQELVDTVAGVRYINDSKATNADASEKALICYPAIYWIAGGLAKAGGIAPLAPYFGRLRHAFLIGNATEEFAATLDGKVPFTRCGDLTTAVAAAAEQARGERVPGAVVLLSPACASFDQFTDFEARGDRFRELVAALPR